ncbi:MAG: NAD(P)-dependent oxidoreductase [Glaciihabitans sp.]|jgi:dTDP-4-dehydrorhamnose reductase|nr:NAD(P)-dependent oxidoreductase [Glaciihabitans sp.]
MTRWLITGASGMLGQDLGAELAGEEVTALTHADLDITDSAAVAAAVGGHDVVVNLAAFTRVDDAETEVDAATAVNATGAGNLAAASRAAGAKFIQLSTDYVFDGRATTPYAEDAPLNPLSVYGRSKAEGERLAVAAHPTGTVVLRTAWLYGAHGDNFVAAMLRLAAAHPQVSVLTDQRGQPTWTVDLARRIVDVVKANVPAGIYHATNSGAASRFEFAREIFALAGLDPSRVVPAEGDSFVRPAPRPAYSVLGHDRWAAVGLPPMRPWQDALSAAAAAGMLGHAS